MSRAFIREDVDPPERSGRKRAPSGLPPGAVNYITALGAARLQEELTKLRAADDNAERVAASGVGRCVMPDAPAAEIAAALGALLNDRAALAEARRFAGVIAGLGGGAVATGGRYCCGAVC